MPNRASRRCPRCRKTYTGTDCSTCQGRDQAYRDARPDDASAFYHTSEWARISRGFIRQHPWCVLCAAAGERVPAKVADHHPRSRRQLADDPRIRNPDAWCFLRALCIGHHRTETNRLQPGGFIAHPERY